MSWSAFRDLFGCHLRSQTRFGRRLLVRGIPICFQADCDRGCGTKFAVFGPMHARSGPSFAPGRACRAFWRSRRWRRTIGRERRRDRGRPSASFTPTWIGPGVPNRRRSVPGDLLCVSRGFDLYHSSRSELPIPRAARSPTTRTNERRTPSPATATTESCTTSACRRRAGQHWISSRRPGGNARHGEEFHGLFDSAQFYPAEALACDVDRQFER